MSYAGNPGGMMPKPVSYDADYNATISANRATEGRTAVGNSNLFSAHINQTTHTMRYHETNMGVAPSSIIPTPPTVHMAETRSPQSYSSLQRNSPDILDAFKANPYTQSLHSVA
jgi:hypothetical protein